jgi:hypothetical protein
LLHLLAYGRVFSNALLKHPVKTALFLCLGGKSGQ